MSPRPYVFVAAGPDWGRHPCSLSHIVNVVVRDHPVVWINSIAQRRPRLCRQDIVRAVHKAMAAIRPRPQAATGGPLVVHPRAVPYHEYAPVRSVNGWLLARQLRPVLTRFPGRKVILVATNPAAVALANTLRPDATIYFCMDDYARMQDSDAGLIEVCERLMLARADATLVTSQALVATKGWRGKIPMHIPQGVDFGHFAQRGPVPKDLARIPHPIIGFQGIIGPRVDIDLLAKIARRFPQASLVLVGKKECDLTALESLPNVYILGAVPYAALPSVIQIFDIGLVAYRYDEHVASVNPLKLLEYLALGQDVVSVDLPELQLHEPYVRSARSHDDYIAAVAAAVASYPLSPAEQAARRVYASRQSWESRAARFLEICDALMRPEALARRAEDRIPLAGQRTSI